MKEKLLFSFFVSSSFSQGGEYLSPERLQAFMLGFLQLRQLALDSVIPSFGHHKLHQVPKTDFDSRARDKRAIVLERRHFMRQV